MSNTSISAAKLPQRTSRVISRRTLLRGAGSVAIGLPLLDEMQPRGVNAQATLAPTRCITLFFGLGLPLEWQTDLSGPLEAYKAAGLTDKMAFFNNVSCRETAGSTGAHCETAPIIFVGELAKTQNQALGASIDILMKEGLHPNGVPTRVGSISSGIWYDNGGGGCSAQLWRSWNKDGTVAAPIQRQPSVVFDQLFGGIMPMPTPMGPDPNLIADLHKRRSILDTVLSQYESLRIDGSYLGTASRQKLDQYFTRLREVELQLAPTEQMILDVEAGVAPAPMQGCPIPARPTADLNMTFAAPEPHVTVEQYASAFKIHSDLWVLGLRCDALRFGNLSFRPSGGVMHLDGSHQFQRANGQIVRSDFPLGSEHFDYFHTWRPEHGEPYQHFAQTNLAYFLKELDSQIEEGNKTLLDNSLVVIGTEYGKNHELTHIHHAIAGGGGRFKPGFYTAELHPSDVYNAAIKPYGLPTTIGQKTGVGGTEIPRVARVGGAWVRGRDKRLKVEPLPLEGNYE